MQKTSNGKKTFLPSPNLRPSQQITKSPQKLKLHSHKPQTQPGQDMEPQQTVKQIARKRNFQYYFYDKYNSTKQLNQLRNNPSTKNLLGKQRLKSIRLDNELEHKLQRIIEGENEQSSNIPFYKRYKPQPITNDPQLADYGQFYSRKNFKQQASPSHNFQKLKQNKQNIYMYRQTRGMVSPQKKSQQNAQTQRPNDVTPKYNRALSPFEFKDTIQGRLATRSSRNIRMDLDKTHKINNVNKIWYRQTPDVQKQNQEFLKMRKSIEFEEKIRKCHSFDSYKGHKLFQSKLKKIKTPADDKFYDPDGEAKHMPIYQQWRTQNHIDMAKATDRSKLPQKLGTHLQYQIPAPNPVKSSSKKFSMGTSSSERNLVFTRQVISPTRGCYR